jgi:hypothetical protein
MVLPNVSQLGLRLGTAPTLLAHRLTGYVPMTCPRILVQGL